MKRLSESEIQKLRAELGKLAEDSKAWIESYDDPHSKWNQSAKLEFPLGEIAIDGLRTIALLGIERPKPEPILASDRFNAQGLEGKISRTIPLREALIISDMLDSNRRQIFA
jgi:hypothetical protein